MGGNCGNLRWSLFSVKELESGRKTKEGARFNRVLQVIQKAYRNLIRVKDFIMQSNTRKDYAEPDTGFFSRHFVLLLVILIVLFAIGAGIRIYRLDSEPLARREYWSAIWARSFYYSTLDSATEWEREIAASQGAGVKVPLMTIEGIAYLVYHLAGGEYPWLLRVFSSLSWLAGGVLLYLLAKRVTSKDAAVLSTAFYLLVPFGVEISRRFQADSLMVAAMLCSIYVTVLYNDQPTTRRALVAGLIAALAILIRPLGLFMIFGAFVLLTIARQGIRESISDRHSWLFAILALFPTALLYTYDYFYQNAQAVDVFKNVYFQPHLLLDSVFYTGWWRQISKTIGIASLVVALLGIFLFRSRAPRALVVGLWCGYAMLGLLFVWPFSTHDYFHLQLVPLVALCLGPVGALILAHVREARPRWLSQLFQAMALGVLIFLLALGTSRSLNRVIVTDSVAKYYENQVRIAQDIGEELGHSSNTVFLAFDYGNRLKYYGWIDGASWPIAGDLRAERLFTGKPNPGAEERFHADYASRSPEYFIVIYMEGYKKQKDLREFLTQTFPMVAQTEDYLIFDLRKTIDSERTGANP